MDINTFRDSAIKFENFRGSLGVEDRRFSELIRSLDAYSNSNETLRPSAAVLNAGIDAIGFFLFQPHVTMAVIRCFLPIVPELVSRNLSANCKGEVALEDRENLYLSASLILQVLPGMLYKFLDHFKSSVSMFERVLLHRKSKPGGMISDFDENQQESLLRICQAAYNFLSFSDVSFQAAWDWTPIFDLASCHEAPFGWYAARSVAILLQLTSHSRRAYWSTLGYDEHSFSKIPQCLDYNGPEVVNAKQFIYDQGSAVAPALSWVSDELLPGVALSSDLCNVGNLLLPRKSDNNNEREDAKSQNASLSSLILTPNTIRNIKNLAACLCREDPVLLIGPSGCGKTSILRHIASIAGQSEMIELHLDENIDSKSLLGAYVCTDVPGQFRWQAGALTQAVQKGLWVVIEDIDRAPFEVLASIVPLLETRKLVLPGRAEEIDASPGFRLFGTLTASSISNLQLYGGSGVLLKKMWRKVEILAPPEDEILLILGEKYPDLSQEILSKILQTFLTLTNDINVKKNPYSQHLSLRHIIKWTHRIAHSNQFDHTKPSTFLAESQRFLICSEAIDLFCGFMKSQKSRHEVATLISNIWDIDDTIAASRFTFKPSLKLAGYGLHNANVPQLNIGRSTLSVLNASYAKKKLGQAAQKFALTGQAARLLEKISVCVKHVEPVLLVGETGCGKTTVIQYLANLLGQNLVVHNLNIQSDSSELLGGFKPVDTRQLAIPIFSEFLRLFEDTFNVSKNAAFLNVVRRAVENQKWKKMVRGYKQAVHMSRKLFISNDDPQEDISNTVPTDKYTQKESKGSKRVRDSGREGKKGSSKKQKVDNGSRVELRWSEFAEKVSKFEVQIKQVENSFSFAFIEGTLVKALKEGSWILLDEINLASPDTLERLCSILDNAEGTLSLTEKGDICTVKRNPNFRIFGAMNPATDVGKRDLAPSLRNRFTEIYVNELSDLSDLQFLCESYMSTISRPPINELVTFYNDIRGWAKSILVDGAGHSPHFSLRTFCRALSTIVYFQSEGYSLERSLYEGLCMSFVTQLESVSMKKVSKAIKKRFCPSLRSKDFSHAPRRSRKNKHWIPMFGFLIEQGTEQIDDWAEAVNGVHRFVITDTVKFNLARLARCLSAKRYPILLQGPTSSGKTTLVSYLAAFAGHKCVRINNHEHTDLQEYMGSYVSNHLGKLVFKEGLLVQAVRNGWWLILDELNLAPSEVLEALNRLLDDNRELIVPETQEVIIPHKNFTLFATQNPPGLYGGRKPLSRAFRNRFLELHVDEIPNKELSLILHKRGGLPPSFCSLMIEVMTALQEVRRGSQIFAGKDGFITTRDLLRWSERKPQSKKDLAEHGYMLLAERLRRPQEREIVNEVLEKVFGVKVNPIKMYERRFNDLSSDIKESNKAFHEISITPTIKRLYVLMQACIATKEPTLLVGNSGVGKTTVCQLLSLSHKIDLKSINCHQYTETADMIGGLRPVRNKDTIISLMVKHAKNIQKMHQSSRSRKLFSFTSATPGEIIENCKAMQEDINGFDNSELFKGDLEETMRNIRDLHKRYLSIFEWQDGPLVQAMRNGDFILLDEISLAEDAVLERLNSVLEPSRTITLAEKGGDDADTVTAVDNFGVFATMNPGGDFGKKELSPALRNRFTEIWVPDISDEKELLTIIRTRLKPNASTSIKFDEIILKFVKWFNSGAGDESTNSLASRYLSLTLRDILSWAKFISVAVEKMEINPWASYVHGACLVLLDGLGLGSGLSKSSVKTIKEQSFVYLLGQIPVTEHDNIRGQLDDSKLWRHAVNVGENLFQIGDFSISLGKHYDVLGSNLKSKYAFTAPTTSKNLLSVVRALQLDKAILLEGSPGVGKTSLISMLARATGHNLVRINLSEQSDISDLLGSDLPAPISSNEDVPTFAWCDGVFLRALQNGDWVLLDELNLAPQAVLEGLNACLDHRSTIYIPEIDRSFSCPKSFRIFAAQNPLEEGGGRKGLPKSFLNRFTKVHVESLTHNDLIVIASSIFPQLNNQSQIISNMIQFNSLIHEDTMVKMAYGRAGAPWEFNLRDVFRWCDVIVNFQENNWAPEEFVDMMYLQRLRNQSDRDQVAARFSEIFGVGVSVNNYPKFRSLLTTIQIGKVCLSRKSSSNTISSPYPRGLGRRLEHIGICVEMNWPCLLVGPSGSGKSKTIRWLASATGNNLRELVLNSSTDATELLGCYEQIDFGRWGQKYLSKVLKHVSQAMRVCLTTNDVSRENYSILESKKWALRKQKTTNFVQTVEEILSHLENIYEKNSELTEKLQDSFQNLLTNFPRFKHSILRQSERKGMFEWIDGSLVQAVESGDWLVLDNANFCNANVLDRLNSLLEPNGFLLINECCLDSGEPRIVRPHKNFRIFLTMDPVHGEISRAMRNRCVEIAFFGDPVPYDLLEMTSSAGIWSGSISSELISMHEMAQSTAQPGVKPSARDLIVFAENTASQVSYGTSVNVAVSSAHLQTYQVEGERIKSKRAAEAIFTAGDPLVEGQDALKYTACRDGVSLFYLLRKSIRTDHPLTLEDISEHIFNFLINSTIRNWSERVLWFCNVCKIKCRDDGLCGQIIELVHYVSNEVCKNELFLNIQKGVGTLIKSFPTNNYVVGALPDIFPFIQNNPSFVDRMDVLIARDRRNETSLLWERTKQLSRLLVLYFRNTSGHLIRLQKSTRIQECLGTNARSMRAVISIFERIDESIFHVCCKSNVASDHLTDGFKDLFESRDSLLQYLHKSCNSKVSLLSPTSLFYLRRLGKTIRSIENKTLPGMPLSCRKIWKKLNTAVASTCSMFVEDLTGTQGMNLFVKNRLWTYGGHPIVPANENLYIALGVLKKIDWRKQISDMEALSIEDLIESKSRFIFNDFETRRESVQGICSLEWASLGNDNTINSSVITGTLSSKTSNKRTELTDALSSVSYKYDDGPQLYFQTGDIAMKNLLKAWADINLWSLADVECLCQESRLVSELLQLQNWVNLGICASNQEEDLSQKQEGFLKQLLINLQSFIHASLSYSSFDSIKLSPYQHLQWSFVENHKMKLLHVEKMLRLTLPSIVHNFHQSLWNVFTFDTNKKQWSLPYESIPKTVRDSREKNIDEIGVGRLSQNILHKAMRIGGLNDINATVLLDAEAKSYFYKKSLQISTNRTDYSLTFETSCQWQMFLSTICYCTKNIELRGRVLQWQRVETSWKIVSETLQEFQDSRLKKAGPNLVFKCFEFLHTLPPQPESVAKAWVYLGLLRIMLLLPSSPLDPSQKQALKKESNNARKGKLEHILDVKESSEKVWSGGIAANDPLAVEIKISLENIFNTNKTLQEKIVYRPSHGSSFVELYHDLHSASNNLFGEGKILDIFDYLQEKAYVTKSVESVEETWQSTSNQFIKQTSSKYAPFEDVTVPVLTAMYYVKHGVRLFALHCRNSLHHGDKYHELFQSMALLPSEVVTKQLDAKTVTDYSHEYRVGTLHVALLRSWLQTRGKNRRHAANTAQLLHSVFSEYITAWKEENAAKESEQAQSSNIYKFKDDQTNAELVEENEFKSFFPTIYDSEAQDELPDKSAKASKRSVTVSEEDMALIWKVYSSSYDRDTLYHPDKIKLFRAMAINRSGQILSSLVTNNDFETASRIPSPVAIYTISKHANKLSLVHDELGSSSFEEFHWMSNPQEILNIMPVLHGLIFKVKKLLDLWPGNNILLDIARTADRILRLPTSSSMFQVLSKVENLTRVCQLWQQVTRKEDSLNIELSSISKLIIKWRKHEINCWSNLLEYQDNCMLKKGLKWWFHLYGLLSNNSYNGGSEENLSMNEWIVKEAKPPVDSPWKDVYDALDSFIRTSPLGEFRLRLEMLKRFSDQCHMEAESNFCPAKKRVGNFLFHLCRYHSQHIALVDDLIKTRRQPMEKKLIDHVKLSKWDEQSYYSLKESAEKSHRTLFRIVREYKKILELPVAPFIDQHVNSNEGAGGVDNFQDLRVDDTRYKSELKNHNSEELIPRMDDIKLDGSTFLPRLPKICHVMKKEFDQIRNDGLKNNAPDIFTNTLISKSKSLASNNHKGNNKLIKKRALVFLLKTLKEEGLKNGILSLPKHMFDSSLLYEISVGEESLYQLEPFKSAEDYFYKNLLHMQRFRLSATSAAPHPDISGLEVKLMRGFSENILIMVLRQRHHILACQTPFKTMKNYITALSSLGANDMILGAREAIKYTKIICCCNEFRQKLEDFLLVASEMQKSNFSNGLKSVVNDLEGLSKHLDDVIKGFEGNFLHGVGSESKSIFIYNAKAVSQLCAAAIRVHETADACTKVQLFAGHILDPQLRKIVSSFREIITLTAEDNIPKTSTQKIPVAEFDAFVSNCLIKFQNCKKDAAVKGTKTLGSSQSVALQTSKTLNLEGIVIEFETLLLKLTSQPANILTPLVTMLSVSTNCFSETLNKSLYTYRSFNKLLYVLLRIFRTLSARGFCSPPEDVKSEDEDGGDDGDCDGTGMAEGSGEQDVTDEIEDEDQILGLQGEEQSKESEDNKDEKSEGVEMSTDFDGQLEDINDDKPEEDGSENDSDEEEVDREMNDMDDDDMDVIDEKMWNDEEDDDTKDQDEKFEKDAPMDSAEQDEMRDAADGDKDEADNEENEAGDDDAKEKLDVEEGGESDLDRDKINEADNEEEAHDVPLQEQEQDGESDIEEEIELSKEIQSDAESGEDSGEDVENEDVVNEDVVMEDSPDPSLSGEDDPKDGDVEMEEMEDPEQNDEDDNSDGELQKPLGNDAADNMDVDNAEDDTQMNSAGTGAAETDSNDPKDDETQAEKVENDDAKKEKPEDNSVSNGASNSSEMNEDASNTGDSWKQATSPFEMQNTENRQNENSDQNEPNPYRNPGNAEKEWHRRLDMVDETLPEEEVESEVNPVKSAEYKFDQSNLQSEDLDPVKQVLAPNNAEQAEKVSEDMEAVDEEDGKQNLPLEDTAKQNKDSKHNGENDNSSKSAWSETVNEAETKEEDDEVDESDTETTFAKDQQQEKEDGPDVVEGKDTSDDDEKDEDEVGCEPDEKLSTAHDASSSTRNGYELYSAMSAKTAEASSRLCEQLRLILEPTLTTKFCGDYRTGKRINMRKIIPYIASSFKKDKIWLRRKKPSKREYQIAIVIDDSNSMASSQSKTASPGTVACEALVTLANAMTRLEVGDIAVASFGETTKFLHNFQTPFSVAAAASALEQFTFRQRSSPMTDCIKSIHEHFIDAQKRGGSRLVEYQQISFVVTDAIFDDDAREKVPHWIRKATEHGQLIVMIMIDKEGEGTRTGVASIKRVKYVKGKPTLVHYLENYPFPYFIIVQDVEAIPEVLSDALRQWFQMLNQD